MTTRRKLGRREFLQGLGAGGLALAGLTGCGSGGVTSVGRTIGAVPPKPIPAAPILVVLNIDGGYDWLNVMPPMDGANRTAYLAKRPVLGIQTSAMTAIGSGVGLNNDLTGMWDLHALGRVAWIPGIGMNNPNLSHFVSIDLWGQGAATPNGTGWLGRFADQSFSASDALRGLTVTSDLPTMLRGATRSFVSITGSSGYVYPSYLRSSSLGSPYVAADVSLLKAQFGNAVGSTTADAPSQPGYAAAASSGKAFLDATARFGSNLTARTPTVLYPGDGGYPVGRLGGGGLSGGLSSQLKFIAQMIANDLPVEVYFCRLGGWDTHSNQAVDHPNLQRTLGGSLSAFYQDLASIQTASGNAQDRVMVAAYSEFGRRVQENDGGTDHGTAGLSFCMGAAVQGGFYGAYPDLNDLDGNGNMKYTVDFRSLYATVLDRWLGQPASTTDALLGTSYPRLGFL